MSCPRFTLYFTTRGAGHAPRVDDCRRPTVDHHAHGAPPVTVSLLLPNDGPRECVVVGIVDGAELADRFGLGRASKLSDGPVARGRQGEVWRLETAEGRWAVKAPFQESGEDRVRVSAQFQEAACATGVPAPSSGPRPRAGCA